MFFLKRKVRNKNRVEGSISAQYIYEEVATFCARYFAPEIESIHNRASRNDPPPLQDGGVSLFRHSCQPFGKGKQRLMTSAEKNAAELYVLDNCPEVNQFAE